MTKLSDTELRNSYPINTFSGTTQDELVEFIHSYAEAQTKEVLDRLEKSSRHYTPDGLVADGLDPWAVSVKLIQIERSRNHIGEEK